MKNTAVQIGPALCFDNLTSGERVRILGKIPEEALGFRVKKVTFYSARRTNLAPGDRWNIQLGTLDSRGNFKVKWQKALSSGTPAGLIPMTLKPSIIYHPGDVVAGRIFATGAPLGLIDPQMFFEIEEP